jgi:iron complex outermembrane receptor protein
MMVQVRRLSLAMSASTLALFAASPAAAQPGQDQGAETAPQTAEETPVPEGRQIIVTGTRRGDRTQAESPVPNRRHQRRAIAGYGLYRGEPHPQPARSILQLPATRHHRRHRRAAPRHSARASRPTRRWSWSTASGGTHRPCSTSTARSAAARPPVDLNTIPTLAIDRIEVLRDGASSQYGSDAIAGVINVQLGRRPGGRAQVTYGRYITQIGGVQEVTGVERLANGEPRIDADGNFVLTTNGRDREAEDGDTVTFAATYGFALGDRGHINLTGEYRDRDFTNRSGYDPRRQFPTLAGRRLGPA